MGDDLVVFLRERLDEDQALALRVHQPFRLYVDADGCLEQPMQIDDPFGERNGEYEQDADGDDRLPNHHNSWNLILDPRRMLRDVEAKRQIVGYLVEMTRGHTYGASTSLALLASVYQDHPDYLPEWRV